MSNVQTYRMPTLTYSSGGISTQSIPNHDHLEGLNIRQSIQYDTGTAVTRLRDGYADQIMTTFTLRRGGTTYARIRGMDLHWVHEVLQKEAHGGTQVTNSTGQSNSTTGSPLQLDLQIPVPKDPGQVKSEIEIIWGNAASLGTGYTIDSSTVNGSFNWSDAPLPALRVLSFAGANGITSTENQIDIPVEGDLMMILIIMRANASPNALRDPTNAAIRVRIEGSEKFQIDWLDAKEDYKNWVNKSAVQTGVGLLVFKDLPLIRGSSYLYVDVDSTATDVNTYGFYTSGAKKLHLKSTAMDVLKNSGSAPGPVSGSVGRRRFGR